jgi:hypothetical protein
MRDESAVWQALLRRKGLSMADLAAHLGVCVLPVWPGYEWRNLVAFHAAWGAEPEPRKLFVVDQPDEDVPLEPLVEQIRTGLELTLLTRAQARDPVSLAEVQFRLQRLH